MEDPFAEFRDTDSSSQRANFDLGFPQDSPDFPSDDGFDEAVLHMPLENQSMDDDVPTPRMNTDKGQRYSQSEIEEPEDLVRLNRLTHTTEATKNARVPTFVEIDKSQHEFVSDMKNKNTVRKTESVLRTFRKWLCASLRFEIREVYQIVPLELDNYIGSFLLSIRKCDGSEYEPDTLTSYHRGIERHLQENGYTYSTILDREFKTSRDVLASKRKELKQKGKGNHPNRSEPLSRDEQAILSRTNVLGCRSPKSLQHKVWLNNTMHFGLRPTAENRALRWDDLTIKSEANGLEYIEFNERTTKTRTGENPSGHERAFNPKQFAQPENTAECPVATYKEFRSHRPTRMCQADSPFYLAIHHQRKKSSTVWYKCQPLGENSLGDIMKTITLKAKIPGRKTNHSARRTTATRLLHAGVPPTTIIQLTGHKNVSSLNNYAVASHNQQKEMSNILAREATPSISSTLSSVFNESSTFRPDACGESRVPCGNTVSTPTCTTMAECASSSSALPSLSHSNLAPLGNPTHAQSSPIQIQTQNTCHSLSQATTAGIFHGAVFHNCTLNITISSPSFQFPLYESSAPSQPIYAVSRYDSASFPGL